MYCKKGETMNVTVKNSIIWSERYFFTPQNHKEENTKSITE